MNRAELVDALAERHEMSRRQANEIVGFLFHPSEGVIAKSLKKGDTVSITGFGVFSSRKRNARTARNPQTGESIKVAATKVPAFKAGASLKGTISGRTKAAAGKSAGKSAGKAAKSAKRGR